MEQQQVYNLANFQVPAIRSQIRPAGTVNYGGEDDIARVAIAELLLPDPPRGAEVRHRPDAGHLPERLRRLRRVLPGR